MDPIIIIGSGLAGYSVAREYRKFNQENPLCIITTDHGHYYSKPQLSTALTQRKTADLLTRFSVEEMRKQLNATIYSHTQIISINPDEKSIESSLGKPITYSKLILAIGAKAIDHELNGSGLDLVFSVNDLIDYTKFRSALHNKQRVTILGTGLIGCEFANDLINTGIKVNMISSSNIALEHLLPKAAGLAVARSFKKKGVTWHWETFINNVDKTAQGDLEISLSNGKNINTDLLLSAIGLKPNLNLAIDASLQVKHGIVVDQYLQTSNQHIYALGDCAEVCGFVLQHTVPISHAAKALAKTLDGRPTPVHYPAMPVNVKTPVCPVVVSPPPADINGVWKVQEAGTHVKAVFMDQKNHLRGFALTGDRTQERLQLSTLLPPILD